MPTRLFMCVRNAVDEATLSLAAGTVVSTLPLSNLQLPARGRIARFTPISTSPVIRFTFAGAGRYFNFMCLNRHNLESAATWRVRLYSDAAWTTGVYDSGTVAAVDSVTLGDLDWGFDALGAGIFDSFLGQKHSVLYFNRVGALSGDITINDSGNSGGKIELSRIFGGDGTEFTYNAATLDGGWRDMTDQKRSAGGGLRSDGQIAYREYQGSLNWLADADRPTFSDMMRWAGKRKDVFFSAFPTATGEKERDYTMIGKFTEMPDISAKPGNASLWASKFKIQES